MNKLIIEGMEYSLEKSTSILHHFNTPKVQFQGNTYYGLAVKAQLEKAEQSNGWISVKDLLPKEGGRYWCYVEEVNDLGISHFQWNCAYNEDDKSFSAIYLKGGKVTHWMPLPAAPKKAPAPEKNYKILEGQFEDCLPHKWDEKGSITSRPCTEQGCTIYSVKRLSDGEVFKLGDTVTYTGGKCSYDSFIIGNFYLSDAGLLARTQDYNICELISEIKHTKKPLFKTEDGVELFDGDDCWYVSLVSDYNIHRTKARPEILPVPSYFKFFSQERFALDYAALNAHILSLKDMRQYISGYKEYKHLLALVKNKLTGSSHQ